MPAESDNFDQHGPDEHGLDEHGLDEHGLDEHGLDHQEQAGEGHVPGKTRTELIVQAGAVLEAALLCEPEQFDDAIQARNAAVDAEAVRRLGFVASTLVLQDMVESRTCDEHGHASAKVMYGAVNDSSGRDLYGLEQVRKMLQRGEHVRAAACAGRLSEDLLRLLARIFANRRVRQVFIDHQRWLIAKAKRLQFKDFEILMTRWLSVHDQDGPDPNIAHEKRSRSTSQDLFTDTWQTRSTQTALVGAAMNNVFIAYLHAEFLRDWEAAKAIHGDKTCKRLLARTDAQRAADAEAQIFADAGANPNGSMPFNFVHNIVWSADGYEEMARRHAGQEPQPFDLDTFRCETIDGQPLEPNETFIDSLMNPFRRVVMNAKNVVINMSEKRFFTGLSRTALQIAHHECNWPGCHVPTSRCQADHSTPKNRGGPTIQCNGTMFCGRHNRHKERGYTVWHDEQTGQIRIRTPQGHEITRPWDQTGTASWDSS